MDSSASKMKIQPIMPVREVPQMMTPSPSNSSQKTEDHSRNSKTIFTSKIFQMT
jgi:hypothetical protein